MQQAGYGRRRLLATYRPLTTLAAASLRPACSVAAILVTPLLLRQRNMVYRIQEIHVNKSEIYISQNLRNDICASVAATLRPACSVAAILVSSHTPPAPPAGRLISILIILPKISQRDTKICDKIASKKCKPIY